MNVYAAADTFVVCASFEGPFVRLRVASCQERRFRADVAARSGPGNPWHARRRSTRRVKGARPKLSAEVQRSVWVGLGPGKGAEIVKLNV